MIYEIFKISDYLWLPTYTVFSMFSMKNFVKIYFSRFKMVFCFGFAKNGTPQYFQLENTEGSFFRSKSHRYTITMPFPLISCSTNPSSPPSKSAMQ